MDDRPPSFLTINGSASPSAAMAIAKCFDAIDLFPAIASTIRWLGSTQDEECRFFQILTMFLWMNAVFPAIHNRILMQHD
jgi:hypothetical protein